MFFQPFVLTPYLGSGLRGDISRLEDWSLDFWFRFSSVSLIQQLFGVSGLPDKQRAGWHRVVTLPETCLFLTLHLGRKALVAHLVEKYGCVQEGEEEEKGAW